MSNKNKRPIAVTYLLLFVLIFTGWYTLRWISSVQEWSTLKVLPFIIAPQYFVVSGLLWSLIALRILWGIILRKQWLPQWLKRLSVIFMLYQLLDLAMFQNEGFRQTNWVFSIGLTLLGIVTIYWILTIRSTKEYFGVNNE